MSQLQIRYFFLILMDPLDVSQYNNAERDLQHLLLYSLDETSTTEENLSSAQSLA